MTNKPHDPAVGHDEPMTYPTPPNLRADLDAANARIAALEDVLRKLIDPDLKQYTYSFHYARDTCSYCDGKIERNAEHHDADCPILLARALLADTGHGHGRGGHAVSDEPNTIRMTVTRTKDGVFVEFVNTEVPSADELRAHIEALTDDPDLRRDLETLTSITDKMTGSVAHTIFPWPNTDDDEEDAP